MKGIRRDQWGYRAYVKCGGLQRTKRFKPDTPAKTMQAWRDETRVALRKLKPTQEPAGSFTADVDRYLLQVKAMPTYAQREAHLRLWETALGKYARRSELTAADIGAVLHRWKASGGTDGRPLSAATVNKRRTALMHCWTVLDGKSAANPVRETTKFRAADPLPRGKDPHVIDAALKRAPTCRTRAACRVLLWTGMRPDELQRAQEDDLDLKQRIVIVRTGKGGRVRVVPLTTQAIEAWKEFDAVECWQRVPKAAPMNRLLKYWTGIKNLRVYDLRHSFGTALALRQTRLDVIGALMGHSTLELTKRYTLAAVTPDAHAATRKLAMVKG